MRRLLCLLIIVMLSFGLLGAQWSQDPAENTPVAVWTGDQKGAKTISDQKKGVLIFWYDKRNGIDWDLYAQRMDSMGFAVWDSGGIPVVSAPGHQYNHRVVSDGAGGAFVTWEDSRNGDWDVFLQHMDSSGTVLWDPQGVPVVVAPNDQEYPYLVPDGVGGVYVIWEDGRDGPTTDLYAQHVASDGTPLWSQNGVPVCTAPNHQRRPQAILAPDGGIYVVWYDYRVSNLQADIYMQWIDPNGNPVWQINGIPVSTSPEDEGGVRIVSGEAGGAIVVWSSGDIFAQRIDSLGVPLWGDTGVPVCTEQGNQWGISMIPDPEGGAIIAWIDERAGITASDIYAQRISSLGLPLWTPNGVQLTGAPGMQMFPVVQPDDSGGAFVVWQDSREGAANPDIYAQHISGTGEILWDPNGEPVSIAPLPQSFPSAVSNGIGDLIVAWEDRRADTHWDIYAQCIRWDGTVGPPWSVKEITPRWVRFTTLYQNNNVLLVKFLTKAPNVPIVLSIYQVHGRKVYTGRFSTRRTLRLPLDLPSGVYLLRLQAGDFGSTLKFFSLR